MTTLLHKTNIHKKARVISSGFWELINTFVLTPQQGLAGKLTSFRSVVKHYESDDSTTICDIASTRTYKSISVCFTQCKNIGGGPCVITCTI